MQGPSRSSRLHNTGFLTSPLATLSGGEAASSDLNEETVQDASSARAQPLTVGVHSTSTASSASHVSGSLEASGNTDRGSTASEQGVKGAKARFSRHGGDLPAGGSADPSIGSTLVTHAPLGTPPRVHGQAPHPLASVATLAYANTSVSPGHASHEGWTTPPANRHSDRHNSVGQQGNNESTSTASEQPFPQHYVPTSGPLKSPNLCIVPAKTIKPKRAVTDLPFPPGLSTDNEIVLILNSVIFLQPL